MSQKKDEPPKPHTSSTSFTADDVVKGAGSTPREEDSKAGKVDHEADKMGLALEQSQKRHTAIGGPFSKASIDSTETAEGLRARGAGPEAAKRVDIRGADKGRKLYRIKRPHYRQGIYVEGGSIVSVEADEKPAKDWEEADQKNDIAHFTLPPLPKPTEEDLAKAEEQKEAAKARSTARAVLAGRT